MDALKQYLDEKKIEYYPGKEIGPYLTLGIGGKVKAVIIIQTLEDLKALLLFMNTHGCPFVLLGGGSNVVFPDTFSPLPVIINRTSQMVKCEPEQMIKVDSGVLNKDLLTWAVSQRVGGLEFLAGIPGTVGGAAAVNAGSFGQSISTVLEKATVFAPGSGEIKTVDRDYFEFQYRNSIFKYGREVILEVFLTYADSDGHEIREKVKEKILYRKEMHPPQNLHTAGCFFKNPIIGDKKISAGQLLEKSGFKNTVYHRLEVSGAHANFIINRGGSTFKDIRSLERKIVETVRDKHGIHLEREVIYISPEGEKY
jgi:UDP-N-acetylmuramate dehydrogenase